MNATTRVSCPSCRKEYETAYQSGSKVRCNECKLTFHIPFSCDTKLVEWVTFFDLDKVGRYLSGIEIDSIEPSLQHTANRIYEMRRWNQQELEKNREDRNAIDKLSRKNEVQFEEILSLQLHNETMEEELSELQQLYESTNERLKNSKAARKELASLEQELALIKKKLDQKENLIAELSTENRVREERRRRAFQKKVEQNREKLLREEKQRKREQAHADLIDWAQSASWNELDTFMLEGGGKGLPGSVIDKLIEVHTNRRWHEEDKIRREIDRKNKLLRAETMNRVNRDELCQLHTELRDFSIPHVLSMSGSDFESFVAKLFRAFGYSSKIVGGGLDEGVDVSVWLGTSLYAVVQCKRYTDKSVSASQIRDFVGAYMATDAKKAFFFTTSRFTRSARETAAEFCCMDIYDLDDLKVFVANARKTMERKRKISVS